MSKPSVFIIPLASGARSIRSIVKRLSLTELQGGTPRK